MKALLSVLLTGLLAASTAGAADAQVSRAPYLATPHRGEYARSRVWIPGGTEIVYRRQWVPGRTERVWVAPVYHWSVDSCGRRFRLLVSAGHWKSVCHPGQYVRRAVRVYKPGHWVARRSYR